MGGRRPLLALALALGCTVALPGCYKRVDVTPPEVLKFEETDGWRDKLRVYPARPLIVVYEPPKDPDVAVSKRVRERDDRVRYERRLNRKTPGKIIAETQLNGQRLYWVAFDNACKAEEKEKCALQFVETTYGEQAWELYGAPEQPNDPKGRDDYNLHIYVDYIDPSNELKPGRVESLAEPNEVLIRKDDCGKPTAVQLQVLKNLRDRLETAPKPYKGVD